MKNITNPRLLYCNGLLFLLLGLIASALILLEYPTLKIAILLSLAIWSFARAYYFVFYVIHHYIDPTFHFSGLYSFFQYLRTRPKKSDHPS